MDGKRLSAAPALEDPPVARTETVRNSCGSERKRRIYLEGGKWGNSRGAQRPSCRALAPTIPYPCLAIFPCSPGRNPVSSAPKMLSLLIVNQRCVCNAQNQTASNTILFFWGGTIQFRLFTKKMCSKDGTSKSIRFKLLAERSVPELKFYG
jgi:hypothetical protein